MNNVISWSLGNPSTVEIENFARKFDPDVRYTWGEFFDVYGHKINAKFISNYDTLNEEYRLVFKTEKAKLAFMLKWS
jgi:hypothetical protein